MTKASLIYSCYLLNNEYPATFIKFLGASAYGVSNSGVLSAVTICIGKLATIVLKTPTKKLSQKEIDISEEKKKKLKEKKTLKKEKKPKFPEKFDDEEDDDDDDADCSADSDDDVIEDKEKPFELSQLSQSSQSSQLFDETELAEVRNSCKAC